MAAKKKSQNFFRPQARRVLPEINPEDQSRLLLSQDFLRIEQELLSSELASTKSDATNFFNLIDSNRLQDIREGNSMIIGSVDRLRGKGGNLELLLSDPANAKRLYVSRVSVYRFGTLRLHKAFIRLVTAIRNNFLRLPEGHIKQLEAVVDKFCAEFHRDRVTEFWSMSLVPLLKSIDATHFLKATDNIWQPMHDASLACGLLAQLIWPKRSMPIRVTFTQRQVLVALLELKAFSLATLRTREEVMKAINKHDPSSDRLKPQISELEELGLLNTKIGRRGGCYLTVAGQKRAAEEKQVSSKPSNF